MNTIYLTEGNVIRLFNEKEPDYLIVSHRDKLDDNHVWCKWLVRNSASARNKLDLVWITDEEVVRGRHLALVPGNEALEIILRSKTL